LLRNQRSLVRYCSSLSFQKLFGLLVSY